MKTVCRSPSPSLPAPVVGARVEEEEEVLDRLGQEEGLHAVRQVSRPHIRHRGVAALGPRPAEGHHHIPPGRQVGAVPGVPVQVPGGLRQLRAQRVASLAGLYSLGCKVEPLRGEAQAVPDGQERGVGVGSGLEAPSQGQQARPEGLQGVEEGPHDCAAVHVDLHEPGRPAAVAGHRRGGLGEHVAALGVAEEGAALKEVLKEGVHRGAHPRVPLRPLPADDVDVGAHQAEGGAAGPERAEGPLGGVLEPGVPCQLRQDAKLEDQGPASRRAADPGLVVGDAAGEVDGAVGDACGRVEGWQQALPQLPGQAEQGAAVAGHAPPGGRVTRQQVGGQQAAW